MNPTVGNDYRMQPQTCGFMLDQTQMVFNNGEVDINPRNFFLMQPQRVRVAPSTFVNLSQLHNQEQSQLVSNLLPNTGLHLGSSSLLCGNLTSQINQQSNEIDQFLQTQGAELRREVAETSLRHYRNLVTIAEQSAIRKLMEKEAQAEEVRRLNAELEHRLAQLIAETEFWQNEAITRQAMAVELQAQLLAHEAMMTRAQEEKMAEGEGSTDDAATTEAAKSWSGPSCKACGGVASVVILPCRHLCLCPQCNAAAAADACPVCASHRRASVRVYLE